MRKTIFGYVRVSDQKLKTDGERRYRAHKLAGLKEIEVRVVELKKDKVQRLKRQLISDLLDDKIKTEESYEAIVKLYKMMDDAKAPLEIQDFCKQIGINRTTFQRAKNYINDKQADPDAVKGFSAGVWREVRSLPKEEREELAKIEQEKLEAELEETRKQLSQKQIKQKPRYIE